MRRYNYAKKILSQVIRSLTIGTGDIEVRVAEADVHHRSLNVDDFPEELKDKWITLVKRMYRPELFFYEKGESIEQAKDPKVIAEGFFELYEGIRKF